MSKLLSLKQWVTLSQAASYLTGVFEEGVSVADLYQFALAGQLTLSAHFVNYGRANLGRKMRIRDAGFRVTRALKQDEPQTFLNVTADALPEFEAWLEADPSRGKALNADEPKGKLVLLNGLQLSGQDCIQLDEAVSTIEGVWDLSMRGAEQIDIEHALQREIGGPDVELTHLDGVFLCRPDGVYARLLEHFESTGEKTKERKWDDPGAYYPAGSIPRSAPIVVRPQALTDFVRVVSGTERAAEKPLDERERSSLLCIVGALASLARVDISQPFKAGEQVAAALSQKGISLGARAIGVHLKAVPEAMGRKGG